MWDFLQNIFNYSLIHATIRASTPILYATLAAVITQQADILNVGIEGIMLTSAFTAVSVSYFTGSWLLAVLAAMLVGLAVAGIIGIAHLKYKGDVFAVGMTVNILALALTRFFLNYIFQTNGNFYSEKIVPIPKNISIFVNNEILDSIFNNYFLFEIIEIALVFSLWYLLFRTIWGLRLRSVGAFPLAAETAGINAFRKKMEVILYSGLIGGLGGAHLSLGYSTMFVENMTNGRGFMGVAAMYFGQANPVIAWLGTLLFGLADSVGSRLQAYGIAPQFILMIPYITTVLILAISLSRKIKKEMMLKSSLRGS